MGSEDKKEKIKEEFEKEEESQHSEDVIVISEKSNIFSENFLENS